MDLLRRHHQAAIDAAIAKYPPGRQQSAVLEVLYLAQMAYGCVTEDAVAEVAEVLDMAPTHVRALVGFYTLLLDRPAAPFVVHYCNDLPCALRGADAFLEKVCARLGCQPGETSPDGVFYLETVMCLAACDRAPLMQVNLEYHENLDEAALEGLVTELRAKAAAHPEGALPFGAGLPSALDGGEPPAQAPGNGAGGASPKRRSSGRRRRSSAADRESDA